MAIPDFQTIMRPLLLVLADGQERSSSAIRDALADHFGVTEAERDEELPSGRAKTFANRIAWAITHLFRAELIERSRRSVYRITARGSETLEQHPKRIDMNVLMRFPEYVAFRSPKSPSGTSSSAAGPLATASDQTPAEQIESAYRELRAALAADVLDRVRDRSPEFFEQLVLDVLYAMGYGGRREHAAQRLGKSGDEGVDGVLSEDELGLDLIYVQAKRWANPVGRPEIQKFFGALHGQRATKGVFITTSTFSNEAKAYAGTVTPRVILVDGTQLADFMIVHGVGVTVERRYELKRVDLDYFTTEDEDAAV